MSAGNRISIIAKGSEFLRAKSAVGGPYIYFDLNTGRLSGSLEGSRDRAAFGRWTLLLNNKVAEIEDHLCVRKYLADISADKAPGK
jgi:hypothetical protein